MEYRWTSYGSYLNGGKMGIVDVNPVLGQFSAGKGKAVRAYEQYVLDHMGDGHRGEFYKVEDQRFLGSEGFSDRIQRGGRGTLVQMQLVVERGRSFKVNLLFESLHGSVLGGEGFVAESNGEGGGAL